MERFGPGAYDKLIQDEVVEQYVSLDFCMKPLVQVDHFICHIVFSNGFKTTILYTFGNELEIKKSLASRRSYLLLCIKTWCKICVN